jgi:hypothetical protein
MLVRVALIIFLIIFDDTFSFTKYGIYNGKYLFSSKLENLTHINFVINDNDVIFQNFTNKGYIYTIPEDGTYKLENGGEFVVKGGKTIKTIKKPDFMLNVDDVFYNDINLECDSRKFIIAKKMLASNCGIRFHQYQIVSQYPDFVRMILINVKDLSKQNCKNSTIPINVVGNMDKVIDDLNNQLSAIRGQVAQMEMNNQSKTGDGESISDLGDKANKIIEKINDMYKWSFGVIDADNVLLGIDMNKSDIGNDLIGFYISSNNEIGCIPNPYVNLASKSEVKDMVKILFDKYILLKSSPVSYDKNNMVLELSDYNVKYYNKSEVKRWQDEMFDTIYGDKIADVRQQR